MLKILKTGVAQGFKLVLSQGVILHQKRLVNRKRLLIQERSSKLTHQHCIPTIVQSTTINTFQAHLPNTTTITSYSNPPTHP
jgi:hypothetical protein